MKAEVLDKTEILFSITPLDFVEENIVRDENGNPTNYNTTVMKYDFGKLVRGSNDRTLNGRFLVKLTKNGDRMAFPKAPVITLVEGATEARTIDTFGKKVGDLSKNVVPLHYELQGTPQAGALDFTGVLSVTARTTDPTTTTGAFINNDVSIKATISGVTVPPVITP